MLTYQTPRRSSTSSRPFAGLRAFSGYHPAAYPCPKTDPPPSALDVRSLPRATSGGEPPTAEGRHTSCAAGNTSAGILPPYGRSPQRSCRHPPASICKLSVALKISTSSSSFLVNASQNITGKFSLQTVQFSGIRSVRLFSEKQTLTPKRR